MFFPKKVFTFYVGLFTAFSWGEPWSRAQPGGG